MFRLLLSFVLIAASVGSTVEAAGVAQEASASQPGAALLSAIRTRNVAEARAALAPGAPLESRGADGATPLILAAQVGSTADLHCC